MSTLDMRICYVPYVTTVCSSTLQARLDFATRLVGVPVVMKPSFRVIVKDDLLACLSFGHSFTQFIMKNHNATVLVPHKAPNTPNLRVHSRCRQSTRSGQTCPEKVVRSRVRRSTLSSNNTDSTVGVPILSEVFRRKRLSRRMCFTCSTKPGVFLRAGGEAHPPRAH